MCPLSLWHARMETAGSSSSSDREALAGLVERVTFHNTDNGFCVLRVKARGHRDLVTVLGEAPSISAGEYIRPVALGRTIASTDYSFALPSCVRPRRPRPKAWRNTWDRASSRGSAQPSPSGWSVPL